jgi:hypothetical protein
VPIVEISLAGEIPLVTNVISHYIKKTVKIKILTVNVMELTNKHGYKKRPLHDIFFP